MMEYFIEAASSYAGEVDGLILLVTVLVGFWFILCEVVFFGFILRYRRKEGVKADYITGEEKELAKWIHWPHYLIIVCDIFIIYGAVRVWYNIKQDLPPAQQVVRVIAQQWAWSFVHPGPDGKLDTPDDIKTVDELHIQKDTVYHYHLEARDVLHSFSVPVFRLKQDAIPGRVITGWFKATKTGTFDIQCAEICGIGHGVMAARIVIETPEQHMAWMNGHSRPQLAWAVGD
jgi:cytochrome c oxidase subunit 2